MTRLSTSSARHGLLALLGIGALAATGCSTGAPIGASPATGVSAVAAAPGVMPFAVNCGPGQQALIRPSLIAGQTVSQVDCVPVAGAAMSVAGAAMPTTGAAMPAAYYGAPPMAEHPVVYQPAPRTVYRTAPAARVVRPRSGRSWQKSAIIIGSSAGVGAGVGGAVKGKKGALIGAVIGGGAATIWDQATRKR